MRRSIHGVANGVDCVHMTWCTLDDAERRRPKYRERRGVVSVRVPRDLLRVYRAVREEADDALTNDDLVRLAELLPRLDALRDAVRGHLEDAA
jgi:hypothetical protein